VAGGQAVTDQGRRGLNLADEVAGDRGDEYNYCPPVEDQVIVGFASPPRLDMQIVRNPKPSVFVDATPMNESRDAMISNTPGFLPNSFLPHSTASPAAVTAAAAARLGVPPEWQSACLSTPPTPKKLGWW